MIAKDGEPRARLVAMLPAAEPLPDDPVSLGFRRGRVWIADDFDAPWPEEIRQALGGEHDPDDPLDETAPR